MNPDKIQKEARAIFGDFLRRRGLRQTYERYAILGIVMATPGQFTVNEFNNRIAEVGERFAVATVYAAFRLLMQAGLLRAHNMGTAGIIYERILPGTVAGTVQLVCDRCGEVREVRDTSLTHITDGRRFPRFTPEYAQIYVHGLCLKCRRRVAAEERAAASNDNKPSSNTKAASKP